MASKAAPYREGGVARGIEWAPTLLILGLYNKLGKELGHDQLDRPQR